MSENERLRPGGPGRVRTWVSFSLTPTRLLGINARGAADVLTPDHVDAEAPRFLHILKHPLLPGGHHRGRGWRVDDVRLLMIRKIFPADLKLAPIDTLSTQNVRQAELRFLLDTQ